MAGMKKRASPYVQVVEGILRKKRKKLIDFDDFLGEFSEEEENEEEEEGGGESEVEEEVIGSGDENFDWEMPEVVDDEEEWKKDMDGLHQLIKNQKLENLIPDFDFDRLISTRLLKTSNSGANTVAVLVVDCVDFDGSFPQKGAESLLKALQKGSKLQKLPKLVLVATKVDLLPSQTSPTKLDRWVRHRAKAGGAPKLSGVYLVSAKKDLGVRNLLMFIKELAGPRGNVWVVGAQNAGKSTLINAFAKRAGNKMTQLTESVVPGTTLGIVRIGGILPAKAKMYDTPGLLHPYLMSLRLTRDEQKMVEIRKELQPRTYRMKAGQTVHVGGPMRLDLTHASVETIYPGDERVSELGEWGQQEFKVSGISWEVNSMDIAIAGLGWFSLGLKGEATLRL
ncbi:hypothetical protein AMTR_s00147p00081250 [Amborella trichopoda]|uniref:G domain-containing protein n=1 Tax=Amborella trichopoda TaxID=13333 RepID=W1PBG7_AMBTC|nr:hypothetical protein AMTR_s00147p00081250 [Amborella trichopoda]